MVGMLNRVLWRDLWHLRGQILAAALVLACGVAALLATSGTYASLLRARDAYYVSHRFGDVFVHLKRAPKGLAAELASLPGVAQVHTRIAADVSLQVPGLKEPASARLVSLAPATSLNAFQLLAGRLPDAGASDQVLASEAFMRANQLQPGARVGALLYGRWKSLQIVGIALSPEFVYEVGPGMIFPDNRRFGAMWMDSKALEAAFDMTGAFNDVVLTLAPGAREADVLAALDHKLRPYGALDAYGRDTHLSHRFLEDELGELKIMTTTIPALFMAVAAFLLSVALSRLVHTQRTQIGLLKAFGRSDTRLALHYLGLALATTALGLGLGLPAGALLGQAFVDLYREFFHFPQLGFQAGAGVYGLATGASLLAALLGALVAMRQVLQLTPAEAMRPPAPPNFRAGKLEQSRLLARLPMGARLILRNVWRRPWKAALSVLGMALAIALMVLGRFATDAPNAMLAQQFEQIQRDDLTVLYREVRGPEAALALSRLPGVLEVEPFRAVPVRMHAGHRSQRVELLGLTPPHALRRLLDARGQTLQLPPEGLVLGSKLASKLGLAAGDMVEVEILAGRRQTLQLPVIGLTDEMIGLGAYMQAPALARLLGEERTSSGAYLRLAADASAQVYQSLMAMPGVAGLAVKDALVQSVRASMDRAFLFFSAVLILFSCVIIGGMVYHSARIALAERGNELASLAVLGFSQREVSFLLLGEQALLLVAATPLGLLLGWGLCAALLPAFDRDLFRVPLVIAPVSYVYPVLAALLAAAMSALLVWQRIARLDLIAVLKTRE